MFLEQLPARRAQDPAQDHRDDDRVVELPRDRNEVRDDVDGQCEVADQRSDQQLAAARDARVAEDPVEEHHAVGDEAGERACVFAASVNDEPGHEHRVDRDGDGEGDEEPVPPAHKITDSPSAAMTSSSYGLSPGASPDARSQRLDQHAMAIAADHEGRPRPPVAVFVEAPGNLHSLNGCAAVAARGSRRAMSFSLSIVQSRSLPWLGAGNRLPAAGFPPWTAVQTRFDRPPKRTSVLTSRPESLRQSCGGLLSCPNLV